MNIKSETIFRHSFFTLLTLNNLGNKLAKFVICSPAVIKLCNRNVGYSMFRFVPDISKNIQATYCRRKQGTLGRAQGL